jgi:hypothetical protein
MIWKVIIKGSESYLKYFSNTLNSEELNIKKENGYFILNSKAFTLLSEYNELEIKLNELLNRVNTYAKIFLDSRECVKCDSISKFLEDGTELIYLGATGMGIGISSCKIVGGTETCQLVEWMKLELNNKYVTKALNQIGKDFDFWDSFYKIYEILRDDGFDPVVNRKNELYKETDRLRRTTNHYRHSNFDLPIDAFSFHEAKSFTQVLFLQWIESLNE